MSGWRYGGGRRNGPAMGDAIMFFVYTYTIGAENNLYGPFETREDAVEYAHGEFAPNGDTDYQGSIVVIGPLPTEIVYKG